ncbi:MAG: hypothetical protein K8S23_14830 [Candidatus Cloacimonetes bacterium]|nr:hypothetical protein [Candidatus Cloacimonadota bacterium]
MKHIVLLFILILMVTCTVVNYYNSPYIKDLSISVKLKDPVSISKKEELVFKIINKKEESFYLDTGSLFYTIGVHDESGNSFVKETTIKPKFHSKMERYLLIKGNSELELTLKTDFFSNLSLKSNRNYIFDIEYFTTVGKKPSDNPTFIGRVAIAPIIFRTGD